jgi:hypothetical protein
MDGTCLDVADTAENDAEFGRPGSGRGEGVGAFPQLRLVALAECGTHAMFAAAMGAYGIGEPTLARQLAASAGPGMLILADRGFTAHPLFAGACQVVCVRSFIFLEIVKRGGVPGRRSRTR